VKILEIPVWNNKMYEVSIFTDPEIFLNKNNNYAKRLCIYVFKPRAEYIS
jgi:hypothetical protein